MRMKCLRIFPETMPRISLSEPSSLSLNMALGNACDTVASISIGSDFATAQHLRGTRPNGNNTGTRTAAAMVRAIHARDKARGHDVSRVSNPCVPVRACIHAHGAAVQQVAQAK